MNYYAFLYFSFPESFDDDEEDTDDDLDDKNVDDESGRYYYGWTEAPWTCLNWIVTQLE